MEIIFSTEIFYDFIAAVILVLQMQKLYKFQIKIMAVAFTYSVVDDLWFVQLVHYTFKILFDQTMIGDRFKRVHTIQPWWS